MSLRDRTGQVLNGACAENVSNTPDYILAHYLATCLTAFDVAVNERERWYGRRMDAPPTPAVSGAVLREAALAHPSPPGFRPA